MFLLLLSMIAGLTHLLVLREHRQRVQRRPHCTYQRQRAPPRGGADCEDVRRRHALQYNAAVQVGLCPPVSHGSKWQHCHDAGPPITVCCWTVSGASLLWSVARCWLLDQSRHS